LTNSGSDNIGCELDYDHDYEQEEYETSEFELFMSPDHDQLANLDIAIKGKKREDGNIFLRIRIADREGRKRNIYFPFDVDNDTAMSVATEMVAELDITDQDVTKIADMIDEEIASLVPDWKKGLNIEEKEEVNSILDQTKHSTSRRFLMDYVTPNSPGPQKFQVIHSSGHASGRGRFEEIIHQMEPNQHNDGEASVPEAHYTDIWAQHDELSGSLKQLNMDDDEEDNMEDGYPRTPYNSPISTNKDDDHEKQTRKELRWLKAKYQMQLRELRFKQLGAFPGESEKAKPRTDKPFLPLPSPRKKLSSFLTPGLNENESQDSITPTFRNCVSPDSFVNRKNFSLHRTTSLPVDAVDC